MKTKAMKKLLLLTACLTLLVLTVVGMTLTASAETYSGTCGTNVTWELDTTTGELTISGTGAMKNYTSSSSSRAPWYSYRSSIKTVTIEDGVTSIGSYAFRSCSSLTSITIGDGVTSIGYHAFSSCSSLTSITIGDSVTSIGSYAFSSCSSLTSITIPNSVTSIGDDAFRLCSRLTSITIPDSVTSIGDNAFRSCSSLTSITVDANNPNYCSIDGNLYNKNATTLIQYAIGKSDTSFTIPDSVTSIGDYAFFYCSSLTSITIPDSVTSIGNSAFSHCSSLTSITIPDSVTSIGNYAFQSCSSLTSITIPDGVTSIGNSAFYWCDSLTSITIPDGVTSIGDYAFSYCSSLTSITIPDGVTSIGDNAFSYCSSLTSINIPDGVTSIGSYAFCGCSSLTSITIPDSVTSIGDYAFYWCSSLTSITIGDGVTSIGSFAFSSCSSLTSITIPDGVTTIGEEAFSGCNNLMSVTIPNSVTSIGDDAFSSCSSLTTITIPDSVTSIGSYAFGYCYDLEKIIYCGTATEWAAISKGSNWDYRAGRDTANGTYTLQYHSCVDGVCKYCGEVCESHVSSPAVQENRVEATCTEEGSYESVVYCEVCGAEISRETIAIPTIDHTYGDWKPHDLEQHKQICTNNDCDDTVYAGHTWTDGICEVCGQVCPHEWVNNICTICGKEGVPIDYMNIAIGESITVNYYATVPSECTNLTMQFTMNGYPVTVTGVPTDIANQYVFSFEDVPPQCMGDLITARLYAGSESIGGKDGYTVKAYLEALINGDFDEKTKTVAKDTLIYGGAAQAYKNYNTDALVSDGITGSSYTLPSASGIELSNGTGATFTNATVWFDNINKLRVKFTADSVENLIVKINGIETEYVLGDDGKYHVHTEALRATEFDKFFTFEIYINGELVSSLKYSVNSYVYTMLSSTNEPMKNLAIALYNYGYSADIYNKTPQTPMLPEEEAKKADPTKSFQGEEHLFTPFG